MSLSLGEGFRAADSRPYGGNGPGTLVRKRQAQKRKRTSTYSYYSKVCEEKSGGETQTPFYVTVAASFVQLYSNNIGGEAAGLVLFDEAFNNMDDERIGGVLEFLRRLPLQLIIAAPPDKIQYIGPAMDEVMLVMTDQKRSYVEEYHNAV